LPILFAQIPPLVGVLAVIGVIAVVGFLLYKGFSLLARIDWGWNKLAQVFPPPQTNQPPPNPSGEKFRAGGFIGGPFRFSFQGQLLQPFTVQAAQHGLRITASFAHGIPIFIPWTSIREATWTGGSILTLTIENPRTLQFYLPQNAAQIIEENIPADRFRKESLGDLFRNRLRGR
jgi:hypothetical protein